MGYILILGANSDIAKSLAEKYAKNGYNLYLASRDTEELSVTQQYITETYDVEVHVNKFDVLEFYNHRNFYGSLSPAPDGVICAVGYLGDQKRAMKDFLESKKIIDTNFTGVVSILNIIANDFEARNAGFIIGLGCNIDNGFQEQGLYTYSSAKTALNTYLNGLKKRFENSYVHVMSVNSGLVITKMTKNIAIQGESAYTPEQLAEDIFFAQQKNEEVGYKKTFQEKFLGFLGLQQSK